MYITTSISVRTRGNFVSLIARLARSSRLCDARSIRIWRRGRRDAANQDDCQKEKCGCFLSQ